MIAVMALGVFLSAPVAFALPALQLDIVGGTYDPLTETIVAGTDVYTLVALIDTGSNKVKKLDLTTEEFFISVALSPQVGPGHSNLGSFTFQGDDVTGTLDGVIDTTIDATAEMIYGSPPFENLGGDQGHDGGDVGSHGIFDTFFTEFSFVFNSANTVTGYNTADNPGGPISDQDGSLLAAFFQIDATGLDDSVTLHYDLYNTAVKNGDVDRYLFAPYSHDANGGGGQPVPEPSTVLLFGTGVLGLIGYARRKNLKPNH